MIGQHLRNKKEYFVLYQPCSQRVKTKTTVKEDPEKLTSGGFRQPPTLPFPLFLGKSWVPHGWGRLVLNTHEKHNFVLKSGTLSYHLVCMYHCRDCPTVQETHLPRWRQWWVIKKHSVTKPNSGVDLKVICSSSGGTTSLVSLARSRTCTPLFSCAIIFLSTVTAQYFGLIFKSLLDEGSMNGWDNLRSDMLRLRKNPSWAWDAAKNSAIICKKKEVKPKIFLFCPALHNNYV